MLLNICRFGYTVLQLVLEHTRSDINCHQHPSCVHVNRDDDNLSYYLHHDYLVCHLDNHCHIHNFGDFGRQYLNNQLDGDSDKLGHHHSDYHHDRELYLSKQEGSRGPSCWHACSSTRMRHFGHARDSPVRSLLLSERANFDHHDHDNPAASHNYTNRNLDAISYFNDFDDSD